MIERRSQTRFPLQIPATLLTAPPRTLLGITRDVSTGGLFLNGYYSQLKSGDRVEVALRWEAVAGQAATLHGAGRVVRVENGASPSPGLALSFERIHFFPEETDSIT